MIKHANRYDEYAYRIATGTLMIQLILLKKVSGLPIITKVSLVISDGTKIFYGYWV